jgi:hypothetical protein
MKRAALALGVLLILATGLSAGLARALDGFDLGWWHIAGGGGRSTSTNWAVEGSMGLPLAGTTGNAQYQLASGFWYGVGMPGPILPTPTLHLPFRVYLPVLVRQ